MRVFAVGGGNHSPEERQPASKVNATAQRKRRDGGGVAVLVFVHPQRGQRGHGKQRCQQQHRGRESPAPADTARGDISHAAIVMAKRYTTAANSRPATRLDVVDLGVQSTSPSPQSENVAVAPMASAAIPPSPQTATPPAARSAISHRGRSRIGWLLSISKMLYRIHAIVNGSVGIPRGSVA